MKLGFFTMPIHPVDKDWRLSLKEDREAFLLADELGFTEAYVGEHVTDRARTSPPASLYRVARRGNQADQAWHRHCQHAKTPIRLRLCLDPMLDHMLDGRLSSASALAVCSDAEAFGNLEATGMQCSWKRSISASNLGEQPP